MGQGGSHGGQHDTSNPQCRPVRNWVQESARHRCSCTLGSSHRRQTAHPGYDPRRSLGRLSFFLSRSRKLAALRSLKQPPPTLTHFMTKTEPLQSCMFRRQPRRQTKPGSKLSWDCRDRVSTTWTSQRSAKAVSMGHSSKRSFHDSLIGLVSGV